MVQEDSCTLYTVQPSLVIMNILPFIYRPSLFGTACYTCFYSLLVHLRYSSVKPAKTKCTVASCGQSNRFRNLVYGYRYRPERKLASQL